MLLGQPIRQIAYVVNDIRKAAERHAHLYGSGPFFVLDNITRTVTYRGNEVPFDHSSAFGQWGGMQVELLQQNGDEPSILTELYPAGSGRTGLHHVAMIVKDLEEAVLELGRAGHPEVLRATVPGSDIAPVFVDTVKDLGHFVEVYAGTPGLVGFYDMVAKASVGFDGRDPVRDLKL